MPVSEQTAFSRTHLPVINEKSKDRGLQKLRSTELLYVGEKRSRLDSYILLRRIAWFGIVPLFRFHELQDATFNASFACETEL